MAGCPHECELYTGILPEAAESQHNWNICEKNPGHEKFISVSDFVDNYLPRTRDDRRRKGLKSLIDLTVRLRVRYTSLDRPDGGDFSDDRGTDKLRVGTGRIHNVGNPVSDKPCPCYRCDGKVMRKHWTFYVDTAQHVVYDNMEAKNTVIDLFYDDTDSDLDGSMKSLRGLEAWLTHPERDLCIMKCVTCDKELGEKIGNIFVDSLPWVWRLEDNPNDLGFLPSWQRGCKSALIISHPHGQPKQITMGELKYEGENTCTLKQYTTPTCPGSSGAPVFINGKTGILVPSVHNGSYGETSTERYDRSRTSSSSLKRWFNKLLGQDRPTPKQQLNYGHS